MHKRFIDIQVFSPHENFILLVIPKTNANLSKFSTVFLSFSYQIRCM